MLILNYCPALCLLCSHSLSLCVFCVRLSVAVCVQCEVLPSGPVAADGGHHEVQKLVSSAGRSERLRVSVGVWRLMASLLVSVGICCASSWGRTSRWAGCPAPSSHTLCWAPTPCRRSSGTTTPRSIVWTTSQTSSSPQTRPRSWRRRWWSCTSPTGLTAGIFNKSNAMTSYSITEVFIVILRGITFRGRKMGIAIQLNVMSKVQMGYDFIK